MDAQDDLCSEQSLDFISDIGSDLERTITLAAAQALLSDTGKRIDDTFYFQDAFFEVSIFLCPLCNHEMLVDLALENIFISFHGHRWRTQFSRSIGTILKIDLLSFATCSM